MQGLAASVPAGELMKRERGGLETGATQQEGARGEDQKARFALAPKTASYWTNIWFKDSVLNFCFCGRQ